jgi:hypothetical protein
VSVPQALAIRQPVVVGGRVVGTESVFFGRIGLDGKPYAPYGPLVAFLAVPHHLAGRLVARVAGVPRHVGAPAWPMLVGGVTTLASATGAALAVAGFYVAAIAVSTPAAWALVLSLLLGGATVLWPYGTTLYSEAWQAAAFVWAAALLLEARHGRGSARPRVILAAICLAVAGLVKVTGLVFAPAFVLAVLLERRSPLAGRRETAVVLAMGILFAAAIHVWWNHQRFGLPLELGYDWSETIPAMPARPFVLADLPRGLAVLLVSPGKSLLLWAPALILSLVGAARFWHRERATAIGLGAALGTSLVFFGAYLFPEGGYSHGPRNLVPLIPLLLLPAGAVDQWRWRNPAVVACGVLGGAMALLAVSVSFLEDQAIGRAVSMGGSAYYDRIDPEPGRPSNRYRLAHVPFVTALRAPGWAGASGVGQGPDYFPLHMGRARRQFPDGQAIPEWLPAAWLGAWLTLMGGFGWRLTRHWPSAGVSGADSL